MAVIHVRAEDVTPAHRHDHPAYEYLKRDLVPYDGKRGCRVSLMELMPGKSSYPYHYHMQVEECFYILSGEGLLRTPDGEARVGPGDFLYFPSGETGAHKLTNISGSEPLRYLDFDTAHPVDVALYPDSGKIGVYGGGSAHVHRVDQQAAYYDGE